MARNGIWNLIKELDQVAATTVYNGPKRAAEKIVRDLQTRGPAWSGSFSNSWQIASPTGIQGGTGAPGKPQPIYTPALSGQQVVRSFLTKNKIVFTISNFSPYADVATDMEPGFFIDPGTKPINPIEKIGERQKGIRGLLTGTGGNRRTAPMDWFSIYLRAGAIDKAIEIAMRRR
jgi:hypothetical protein